uniref:C2H2-type domain-containing protein n=1 Tax=Oncorhynchus tshawytscha TaxID=74940 RepID=A0AAZ3S4R6_ONCTS
MISTQLSPHKPKVKNTKTDQNLRKWIIQSQPVALGPNGGGHRQKRESFISSKGRTSMDLKSPVQRRCQTADKSFCCSDCGECFTQMGKLNSHRIMIHSRGNQFRCDECGKCFAQWGYLDSHMKIHTRVNCGKVFTQSDRFEPSLTTLKDHPGEKLYCCGECGKYFSNAGSLNYHRRSHTEEKLHRCHDCRKCFFEFRDLNIHRRIHTGEKRFCCQFCGKCYNQHTSLSYHIKNHTVIIVANIFIIKVI